jgi:hypothetical protein
MAYKEKPSQLHLGVKFIQNTRKYNWGLNKKNRSGKNPLLFGMTVVRTPI